MKILVYSDVHGNLPAFEAILDHVGSFDSSICLGDLVNYGPWNDECVDLAVSLPHLALIVGNHEEAFIQGSYQGSNTLVKAFFAQVAPNFNRMEEIKSFITSYSQGGWVFRHTVFESYIYPDTKVQLDADYVIGHSHHQFRYDNSGHTLFNVGSVGQNRLFINLASYAVWDSETGVIELKNVEYNVDVVIQKMKTLRYPNACVEYYEKKARF